MIICLVLAIVVQAGAFTLAMCVAARRGDEAMEQYFAARRKAGL